MHAAVVSLAGGLVSSHAQPPLPASHSAVGKLPQLQLRLTSALQAMTGGIEIAEYDEPAAASGSGSGVIFVLENAQLEAAKVGKNYELLNCDDHANFLRRHNKDPANYRPDICHQVAAAASPPVASLLGLALHASWARPRLIVPHTCPHACRRCWPS